MAWNWQSTCAACRFVSEQLGAHSPCPFHAGHWSTSTSAADRAESCPGTRRTAEQPWPFTPREYARLLLLRSRVHEQDRGASAGPRAPWVCPDWLQPYLGLLTGVRHEPVEELLNDYTADAETDPARARRIDVVRVQVRLLETLHVRGFLRQFDA